jgi:LacI family transcriptional regulator
MVTIKEIANAVGLSSATVSRVLNYDMTLSISAKKRQTIIETAEKLNYATPRNRNRGNGASQSAGTSVKIALVHFLRPAQELADPYYIGVRLGIENRCQAQKIEVVKVYHTDDMPDPGILQNADGVIIVGQHTDAEIDWLQKHGKTLVFADFSPESDLFDSVEANIERDMVRLLDDLDRAGYRRIGFIGWAHNLNGVIDIYGEKRCKAYMTWMRERGRFDPNLCQIETFTLENGDALTRRIMTGTVRPDVLITANDNMAIGAYRACQELGLKIPDDLAIASFNDIPVAQFLHPPLSTVKIPAELIGETAVDMLLEKLAGRDFAKRVILSSEMIWRGSTVQSEMR